MNFLNHLQTYHLFSRLFHFSPLSFNSTLTPNKTCNYTLIWAQNDSIVQKKNLRTKVKILKKYTIVIHSNVWDDEEWLNEQLKVHTF
jgi:hypothetical protein